ncbi:MAG: hypothetical protein EOO37_03410 [Cytophagaceae bacterium]|nr:MAG: hypothetical protein EOO37_03410 [Cytophagaceae bacterium]
MKNFHLLLLGACLSNTPALAQHATGSMGYSVLGIIAAGEYSKDESLYRAKGFVMQDVLGLTDQPQQFGLWALVAATSGELTTLVYTSDEKKREGVVLAFYGNRWSETGVTYKAYGFKDLPKEKATQLLDKLEVTIEAQRDYLHKDSDNNNVFFKYDDLSFLIYYADQATRIRVFWGQYDADWTLAAFLKTKKRMLKKI